MAALAVEEFGVRLQVGRLLRGPLLGVAVAVRNLALFVVTLGSGSYDDLLAPAWVVVYRLLSFEEVGRLAAGRYAGEGERLLAEVEASLTALSAEDFLTEWELDTVQ